MGDEKKWWEMKRSDGRWKEVMGDDEEWWEVKRCDGRWKEVMGRWRGMMEDEKE
jgi:hypothetical protein